jgi:hypothetical protein
MRAIRQARPTVGHDDFSAAWPQKKLTAKNKNAAFPKEDGVSFDRDTQRGIALSLAGLAATYSPRA